MHRKNAIICSASFKVVPFLCNLIHDKSRNLTWGWDNRNIFHCEMVRYFFREIITGCIADNLRDGHDDKSKNTAAALWETGSVLEQRQNKNDSIWSKNKLGLKLPRFFARLFGEWKSPANSNLICSTTKWCRSYIVFGLGHWRLCLIWKSRVRITKDL